MRLFNKLSCIVFFILLSFSLVSAHLSAGEDVLVDGYLIDFGYSPEELVEDVPVSLAFNLVNASTEVMIPPDKVWVRISDDDNIVFSGTFYPDADNAAFDFTFPYSGEFEVLSKFYLGDSSVEHKFFVEVDSEPKNNLVVFSLLAVFVILLVIIFRRKDKL